MNYSVVIVTYNRLNLLKECIAAVKNQVLPFDNIIIIDNASIDGTSDYLHHFDKEYHIIYETRNGGGAKGFKDGVEYVQKNIKTDWILLIDDDAILDSMYLQNIDQFISSNADYMAVSGTVKTDGQIDITHRKRLEKGMTFSIKPVSVTEYDSESFDYDLSSFCGLLFSANLINEIGLPNEEYFIWYDDSEYSLRLRSKTRIANVNDAWLNHKTRKSTQKDQLNWKGYYGIRNMGDIVKKYGTKSQYRLYRLRVRIAWFRNRMLYALKRDDCYRFNYNLYKDALNDMKNNKFGYNERYHA